MYKFLIWYKILTVIEIYILIIKHIWLQIKIISRILKLIFSSNKLQIYILIQYILTNKSCKTFHCLNIENLIVILYNIVV